MTYGNPNGRNDGPSFGQGNSFGHDDSFGQGNSFGQSNAFGQNDSYGQGGQNTASAFRDTSIFSVGEQQEAQQNMSTDEAYYRSYKMHERTAERKSRRSRMVKYVSIALLCAVIATFILIYLFGISFEGMQGA